MVRRVYVSSNFRMVRCRQAAAVEEPLQARPRRIRAGDSEKFHWRVVIAADFLHARSSSIAGLAAATARTGHDADPSSSAASLIAMLPPRE